MTLRKDGALTVTLLYLSIGFCWILFSDLAISSLPVVINHAVQMLKGSLFVVATSGLLFLLVRKFNAKLYESEHQYRSFFENSPVPMWTYDRRTLRFIKVNDAAVKRYGYTRAEFLSMTLEDIRPDHELEHLHRFIAAERQGDFRDTGIWQHEAKDGSVMFVNIVSQQLTTAGDDDLVMVMAKDTTDRIIYENKLESANTELELANRDLRLQKRFLREVQEMARIGGWEYYPAENRFFFSEEIVKILGFNPGDHENPYDAILQHVHPDDRERFLEEKASFDRRGQTLKSTLRFVTDGGAIKYIHRIIRFEYMEKAPYRIRGTMQDVTHQKLMELERDRALERYDLACDATQDMIYEFDIARNTVSYSRNFERITNPAMVNEPDATKAWFAVIHPDDLPRVIGANKTAIAACEPKYTCEYRISIDGLTYRHVLDQACILYEGGQAIKLVGAVTDIHQIKSVSAENHRLAEVINKVDNMALIIGTDNRITWMNRAMERFTGLPLADVIGRSPADVLTGEFRNDDVAEALLRRIARLETFSAELPVYDVKGREYWVKSEFRPLFNDEGDYNGYLVIHTDISELKEKERFLSRQNEALKDIAWMESHELRRPLASLLGLVAIMQDTDKVEEKEEYIRLINICAEEMDDMVRKISARIYETLYAMTPVVA